MGFGVWGLGFGVWGLGFGVWGLGFGVWGLGFGVWGLGFGVWGLGFGVWGLGFGVWGLGFGGLKRKVWVGSPFWGALDTRLRLLTGFRGKPWVLLGRLFTVYSYKHMKSGQGSCQDWARSWISRRTFANRFYDLARSLYDLAGSLHDLARSVYDLACCFCNLVAKSLTCFVWIMGWFRV